MAKTPKPRENTGCLVRAEFAALALLTVFGGVLFAAGLF